MDRALLLLIRLRAWGAVRRMFRRVRGVRGAVALAAGLLVFLSWLLPSVVNLVTLGHAQDLTPVERNGPVVLMGLCLLPLLTGQSFSLAFLPAEVDVLFSGPFARRQLIAYKTLVNALGAAVLALFVSLWLARMAGHWAAPYPTAFLALVFTQLCGMVIATVGAIVGRRVLTGLGRALLALLVVAAGVSAWRALGLGPAGLDAEALARVRDSAPARVVLAPFAVFVNVLTAPTAAGVAAWGFVGAAVDAAIFMLVVRLDGAATEAALGASQRLADMRDRARRAPVGSGNWTGARWAVPWPAPPGGWLGGSGPTAWRQATSCLRGAPGWMLSTAIMLVAVLGFGFWSRLGQKLPDNTDSVVGVMVIIMLTLFQTMLLAFDFRADLDRMESLKALPVRSLSLAAGQLAAPVAFMTASQWLLIGAGMFVIPENRPFLACAALAAPGVNTILVGIENAMFLLYPMRSATGPVLDLQRMGRGTMVTMAKYAVVGAAGAAVAGAGALAKYAGGGSWPAAIVVGWAVLMVAAWCVVVAVAWAFEKFDVSRDVP